MGGTDHHRAATEEPIKEYQNGYRPHRYMDTRSVQYRYPRSPITTTDGNKEEDKDEGGEGDKGNEGDDGDEGNEGDDGEVGEVGRCE